MKNAAARPGHASVSARAVLIRGNLNQAAVGIAAIHRSERAARALFCHRAFLDRNATGVKMRDDLFGARGSEKAQIVAARGLMVGGEPFHLVGIARTYVALLVAEHQRGARRLAAAGIEHSYFHAEHVSVPLGGAA